MFSQIFEHLCESEDIENVYGKNYKNFETSFGKVDVKLLDSYGGEGQGEDYWKVYELKMEDGTSAIYRRNGWYASSEGVSWDNFEEVKAVEVVKMDWVAV